MSTGPRAFLPTLPFHADDRFLPTGSPLLKIAGMPEDLEQLKREVHDRLLEGTHTLLETDGLRINLGNVDPALGNCTVVPLPPGAGTLQ